MALPLLISVPHAGLDVPDEVQDRCILSHEDIVKDGDEGAAAIFWPLAPHVEGFITTDIARAIVDLNRAEEDFRKDGVIKTHTCWDVPVYSEYPPPELIETLLERYHRPYHRRLTELAASGVRMGIDCHTMAAEGPPVGPDQGQPRPPACLGDGEELTCPTPWRDQLVTRFREAFGEHPVTVNDPFAGGFIIRAHYRELPWLQLELSRAPFMPDEEKTARVLEALENWCRDMGWVK